MSSEREYDDALFAQEADLDKQNRAARRRNLAIVALAVLSLLFAVVCLWLASDNKRLADANAQYGQDQAQQKQQLAKEAQQALCGTKDKEIYDRDLCEKWATVAQEPVPDAPDSTAGPTQKELVDAFRAYCNDGDNCRGRDGSTPTADDIAAAFVKFCSTGACTGPAGKNGTDGKDAKPLAPEYEMVLAVITQYCSTGACTGPSGKNGADGKDGANATQEMVLAAVQQVCANDACRGPVGVSGDKGDKGDAGRGIQDATCRDDGRWTITYTDGTTSDGGVCRTEPGPPIGLP